MAIISLWGLRDMASLPLNLSDLEGRGGGIMGMGSTSIIFHWGKAELADVFQASLGAWRESLWSIQLALSRRRSRPGFHAHSLRFWGLHGFASHERILYAHTRIGINVMYGPHSLTQLENVENRRRTPCSCIIQPKSEFPNPSFNQRTFSSLTRHRQK